MEPTATMSHRRPPFLTCGISLSKITLKAYKKAKDLNGPTSSVTNNIAKLASKASPLIIATHYQILSILSFIDIGVLLLGSIVEVTFPPSKHLFNKLDEILLIVETLPGRFDDAVNNFSEAILQVPILNWVLVRAISWLNFLLSLLNDSRSENTEEKEIVVDINCDEVENVEFPALEEAVGIKFDPESSVASSLVYNTTEKSEAESPKFSYKEALQKGTKEEEPRDDVVSKDSEKSGDGEVDKMEESSGSKDNESILELFEAAWLMKPGRKDKERLMPRSVSYQF